MPERHTAAQVYRDTHRTIRYTIHIIRIAIRSDTQLRQAKQSSRHLCEAMQYTRPATTTMVDMLITYRVTTRSKCRLSHYNLCANFTHYSFLKRGCHVDLTLMKDEVTSLLQYRSQ